MERVDIYCGKPAALIYKAFLEKIVISRIVWLLFVFPFQISRIV